MLRYFGMMVLVGLAAAGCSSINNDVCATGRVCPTGLECSKTGEACGSPEQVAGCLELDDDAVCTIINQPGVCRKALCVKSECGNSLIDPGEDCDDGDDVDDNACPNDCLATTACGNAIVNGEEECDCGDGTQATLPANCTGPNSVDAGLCNLECKFHCGDGVRNHVEDCEPGEFRDTDCFGYGASAGVLGCTSICTYDRSRCALTRWADAYPLPEPTAGTLLTSIWKSPRLSPSRADGYQMVNYLWASDAGVMYWRADDNTPQSVGVSTPMNAVWGYVPLDLSREVLYAVGENGKLVSQNLAVSPDWQTGLTNTIQHLYGIWGIDRSPVFIVGANGTAQRRAAGTWAATNTGTTETLRGVSGSSADNVIAVGDGGVAIHWDGTTWTSQPTGTTESLRAVWVESTARAYAVGDNGTVLRWLGGVWSPVDAGTSSDLYAVWGRSAQDVYVGGDNGTIVRRGADNLWRHQVNDHAERIAGISGGPVVTQTVSSRLRINWGFNHERPVLNAGVPMNDVEAAPNGEMFAVGDAGTVWHYDRTSWTAMAPGTTADLRSVWPVNENLVYVAGTDGTVLRYASGVWTDISLPVSATLNGVMADTDSVIVVGDGGVAYDNTSGAWLSIAGLGSEDLHAVWGADGFDLWIVGAGNVRFRFNGLGWIEGEAFTDVPGVANDLHGTRPGASPTSAWTVGRAGVFDGHFATTSTVRFNPFSLTAFLIMNKELHAVEVISANEVLLAGDDGYLIRITSKTFGRLATRTTASIRGVAAAGNVIAYVAADGTVDTMIVPPAFEIE